MISKKVDFINQTHWILLKSFYEISILITERSSSQRLSDELSISKLRRFEKEIGPVMKNIYHHKEHWDVKLMICDNFIFEISFFHFSRCYTKLNRGIHEYVWVLFCNRRHIVIDFRYWIWKWSILCWEKILSIHHPDNYMFILKDISNSYTKLNNMKLNRQKIEDQW